MSSGLVNFNYQLKITTMAIQALSTAAFNTNEVALHLNTNYPYAATCFSQDMAQHGDYVSSTEVAKWFKTYFGSHSYWIYRQLEANVTQRVDFNS